MTPIFLDTNVQVYAAGREHPLKAPCVRLLQLAATHPEAFVTDAEVLQELLHRYVALRLWREKGRLSFAAFAELMRGRVEPVLDTDVERAAALADRHPGLDARDLIHAAVMHRSGAQRVVSADRGFDALPEITRLDPAAVASWEREALA